VNLDWGRGQTFSGSYSGGLVHDLAKRADRFVLMTAVHLSGHMLHRAGRGTLTHALVANAAGRQGDQYPCDQSDTAKDGEGFEHG